MLTRLFTECILQPSDIQPTSDAMQVVGVFNPGAVMINGEVILLVRVAECLKETRDGYTALPRYDEDGQIVVDHYKDDDLDVVDPRVVIVKETGCKRLTFTSYIRVMRSADGRSIDDHDMARFLPENQYEYYGVEDPRITPIDGRYYITYVSVSQHGAATSLAVTDDFITFERLGVIFLPENKDVLLFPGKISGQYVAMHRPNPAMHFTPPEIWLAFSDDLIYWGNHKHLLSARSDWDTGRIGGGCPPVLTDRGWLELYHGNNRQPGEDAVGAYFGAAFIMHHEKPWQIISHSDGPIMSPQASFEMQGFVDEVVFPTGIIEQDEHYLIYYGAADQSCGVTAFEKSELIEAAGRRASILKRWSG